LLTQALLTHCDLPFWMLFRRVKDMTFEQEVQHWVNAAQAEDDAMQEQQQQQQKKQS
jgi:hypothetical protein